MKIAVELSVVEIELLDGQLVVACTGFEELPPSAVDDYAAAVPEVIDDGVAVQLDLLV